MLRRPTAALIALLPVALVSELAGAQSRNVEITGYVRDITVEKGQEAAEITCFFCSVRVLGTVNGDVMAIGGNVEVEGTVKGDAMTCGGGVRLKAGARVEGDADAIGGGLEIQSGAVLSGEPDSIPYLYVPGQRRPQWIPGATFLGANLVLALVGSLLFRLERSRNAALSVRRHALLSAGTGCLLMAIWLLLLGLNAPNAWVRFLQWIANLLLLMLLYCGCTALAWAAGHLAVRGDRTWLNALAGAAVLSSLMLLPVVGIVVFTVLFVVAPGAALVSGLGRDPDSLPRLYRRSADFSRAAAHSAR